MPRKGHTPKQILNKLRQVELAVASGKRVSLEVNRRLRACVLPLAKRVRRTESGQTKKPKQLELQNARLKRAVAELALDKQILKEAAERNFWALHVAASASSTSVMDIRSLNEKHVVC